MGDAYTAFSAAHTNRYVDPDNHGDPHRYSYTNIYAKPDTNAYAHGDSDDNANADRNADFDAIEYPDKDAYKYTDNDGDGDTRRREYQRRGQVGVGR